MNAEPEAVRLYSSWHGLTLAFASPLILVAVGTGAIAASGRPVFPVVLLVAGVLLTLVSLFDFPISVVFDERGVTRHTALRRHTLAWSAIRAVERAARVRRRSGPGALVAVVGRKRYLLVDRVEGRAEFEAVCRVAAASRCRVHVRAGAPADDAAPTWLYHRRPTRS